jgi:tetratricopeptide (TPR) repeat protein
MRRLPVFQTTANIWAITPVVTFWVAIAVVPASLSFPQSIVEPPKFVEAQEAAGLRFQFRNSPTPNKYLIETMGGGVAILDYDSDGWPDVFFVNGAALRNPQPNDVPPDKSPPEYWNRLFRNNHDGTFTDVTEKAGVRGRGYGMGVAVGDYDNDGFPDLFVTNFGQCILYHNNGDGTFTDVTARSGIKTEGWSMSAGFLDYDNDGYLDLFVTRYMEWDFSIGTKVCGVSVPRGRAYCHPKEFRPISNYLFHNNHDGTFSDVSLPSHIARSKGYGLGVSFGDYNNDGKMDIYVANDAYPQFLFRNNGDGTFTEVAPLAGVGYTEDGSTFSGMGTDFVDLDNDGLPDILTTALPYEYFAFFHNNGDGIFNYDSVTSGLAELSRPYGGWGIHTFDCDNDGNNEVFIATSHVMDNIEVTQPNLHYLEKPLLLKYHNGKFVDITAEAGEAFSHPWAARGAAFGDLFNDGHIDIVASDYAAPAHLLRNEGGNRYHWIEMLLQGTRSNRDAIGARVKLTSGNGKVQYRTVSTAGSYASANDRRVAFGLGAETNIREINICWPSGTVQHLESPAPDQILRVIEPAPRPRSVTGTAISQRNREQAHTATAPTQGDGITERFRLVHLCPTAVPVSLPQIQKDSAKQTEDTRYQLGLVLLRQGRIREAEGVFRAVVEREPDFVDARYALGVALSRLGREHFPQAVDEFLDVLRRRPGDIDAWVDLSSILAEEGDAPAAAAQLEQAIRLEPANTDLYILLGKTQLDFGESSQALESFGKAAKLNPKLSAAHYGLGLTLRKQHDPVRAAEEFRTALVLNQQDPFPHLELGKLDLEAGELLSAEKHFDEAIRLRPNLAEAYAGLGKLYQHENASQKAEAAYREALRLHGDLPEASYGLALLLRSQGRNEEARPYFAAVETREDSNDQAGAANALNADGVKEVAEGRLNDALAAFERALATDPSFFMAAYNQGVVFSRLGRIREAVAAFRAAIRLRPDFVMSHYGLGILLRKTGDPTAEEELTKARLLGQYVAQPLGRTVLAPAE